MIRGRTRVFYVAPIDPPALRCEDVLTALLQARSRMADDQPEMVDAEATPPAPPAIEEPVEPLPEWGEDVTPEKDGGLFKTILQAGVSDEGPLNQDEVFVHYTGRLLNGEVFDSSVPRGEPFKFKLGSQSVIKGWDVGVATMKKGEKCILTCQPSYAYGEDGSPPKIPGNATLRFEVELLSWQGEDLSKDGGVRKSVISVGKDYSRPSDGAQCNGENLSPLPPSLHCLSLSSMLHSVLYSTPQYVRHLLHSMERYFLL